LTEGGIEMLVYSLFGPVSHRIAFLMLPPVLELRRNLAVPCWNAQPSTEEDEELSTKRVRFLGTRSRWMGMPRSREGLRGKPPRVGMGMPPRCIIRGSAARPRIIRGSASRPRIRESMPRAWGIPREMGGGE
jgi:hypothetical protein